MNELSCPACGKKILFDPQLLLKGQSFSCSGCRSVISLANEDKKQVESALHKFNQLQGNN
ncbi:hypothetical protein [Xanthovirga aplysinae]|uniref:hypothetical protein n=1 Tax=Xanthovirga aplysinae TaxID=2529853 RepID=UPI0012BC7180|nr:hypothetical protein [Xanthovirga aplysinae]MTI31081.1 hypothetical protein [Xanthovirga aplysinae]